MEFVPEQGQVSTRNLLQVKDKFCATKNLKDASGTFVGG